MKIKLFIVTYKNDMVLNGWALRSLLQSNCNFNEIEIYIIDNEGSSKLELTNKKIKINILRNELRSKNSTGHLSRNWNQGIILGFENLNKPKCDIVLTCQNDTIFKLNWQEKLIKLISKFDFISQGIGDQLQVFTVDAIKQIGLYDERLCNIGYQEADYFLRAAKFYPEKVSINDFAHYRIKNHIGAYELIEETESGLARGDLHHFQSISHHNISLNFFKHKWNCNPDGDKNDIFMWQDNLIKIEQSINNYILYPYFEKDLNKKTFIDQKYIVPNFFLLEDYE